GGGRRRGGRRLGGLPRRGRRAHRCRSRGAGVALSARHRRAARGFVVSGAWVRWGAAIGALGASVACAPQSAPDMPPLAPPALAEVSAAPEGTSEGVPEPIARMLARLVEARGLAAKHAVEARHVSREEAI